MTALLVLLSVAYFALAVASFGTAIAFEVFLWGGLILILGWCMQDAILKRKAGA